MTSTKTGRTLTQILLNALRPTPKVSVSDWADKYRMLPSDAAEPGKWKTSRVPYMREVMNAFTQGNIHRVVVKSASQCGKALDIMTPIATPDGFKLMRDLQAGDKVFDERGEVCNVIVTSAIMYGRDCYELTFSDGAKIVADGNHRWLVQESKHGRDAGEKILTTEEISRTYKIDECNRYAIPVAKALNLSTKELPIDPYTLGAWLGDGNSYSAQLTLHENDLEIARHIEAAGHKVIVRQKDKRAVHVMNVQIDPLEVDENICIRGHDMRVVGKTKKGYCAECGRQYAMAYKWRGVRDVKVDPIVAPHKSLTGKLRVLGVLQNKHIPAEYLRGSYEQRLELLRGLMDTDGTISKDGGCCEITQKSYRLAQDICSLLWTLGLKPTMYPKKAACEYKGVRRESVVWRISFRAYDDLKIFKLERKARLQKSRVGCRTSETFRRRIVDVRLVETRPVKCIAVDSPRHLYLAGRELIPTHNTEVILNIIGRYAHLDACTMMMIQPTLEMAQDISKSRVSKMIADTKVLTPLFGRAKTRDTNQTILSKFFTGGRLVFVGANSPAGLASRPIRILLCDEVDRFPKSAGNEGDPVDLAAKRTTTYWDYKIGLFSTPTNEGASRIDVEYSLGTQEEWRHQCPNCHEYSALDYRQMQVDYVQRRDDAGNRAVIVNGVKWRCPQCGFEFDELTIKNAPQKYVAQNPEALKNGIRSFWLNGFSSPWLTWREIMREWLEARDNAVREAVVCNTRFGQSYKQVGEYSDENIFLERREAYDGELPSGVLLLTAAVDVQNNRLEYEIVGWAEGFERWGILRGIIPGEPNQPATWTELDAILDRSYLFKDGTPLKVARTFVDSGYSTTNVYAYCRAKARQGRFAIKGKAGMGLPLLYKYGRPNQTGILLTILGVDAGKQEVMSNLGVEDTAVPGYMHFPLDDDYLGVRGYDDIYFKQLISERRVVRQTGGILYESWEPTIPKARNESLDLAVYSLAAAQSCVGKDVAGFWARRRELLKNEFTAKKSPAKTDGLKWRSVDIWTQ